MHQYKPRDSTAVAAPLQNPRMASATSAASQRPLRPARHAVNRRLGRLQRQLATFVVLVCGICGLCASSVPEHTITATAPEFRWSYHPSFDAVQFLVLGLPPTATHWALSLSAVSSIGSGRGDGLVVRTNGSLPLPAAGMTLAVPALADGNYSIELMLTAAGGESEERRPLFTKAETFTRARRSWEDNALGLDDVVLPPFEAITATPGVPGDSTSSDADLTVGVVGRKITVAPMGLWSGVEITPQATPRDPSPGPVQLLAKPIQLLVVEGQDGKEVAATSAAPTRVTHATATTLRTESEWSAGTSLRGRTTVAYDIDGCAKITLELQPPTAPISALSLQIPLQLSEVYLMHSITDLLRNHFAGRIPAGDGEVYNTTAINRYQLPGPFVPYIWAGGPERGIAMFSDNDQGWISAEPAYQLFRDQHAGTLTLVANLVSPNHKTAGAGAGAWPRNITFGLMASPAKPQPTTPKRSPRSWWPGVVGDQTDEQLRFSMLGADYYWGGQTPCLQYYPYNRNYTIYNKLLDYRKGVGPQQQYNVSPAATDWIHTEWLSQYTPENCVPSSSFCTTQAMVNLYNSIHYSFNKLSNIAARSNASGGTTTNLVMPYTNPRGVIWDGDLEQFMDEWTENPINDPRWSTPNQRRFYRNGTTEYNRNASIGFWQGWAYHTDPVPSYVDMVLHETEKMMLTFADGTYYDDVFFHTSYQTVGGGPGYVDDDGTLKAGVALWTWREFMKRSAILQHAIGKPVVSLWMHMTNFNCLPILSWGTINLDWEWRDQGGLQEEDVQTRNQLGCDDHGLHCNDTAFILAQTVGLQTGTVPVAISSGLRGPNCTQRPDLHGVNCTAWLLKSHYATAIPHEVRPEGYSWGVATIPPSPNGEFEATPSANNVSVVLDSFGYADPACDVYRFWEAGFPIATSGPYVLPLVISCPPTSTWTTAAAADWDQGDEDESGGAWSAMVFFGSFGPRGMVNFALDRAKLRLSAAASAVDAETGATVQGVAASGNFTFRLDRHSYRIIVIKTDDGLLPPEPV